MTTMMMITMMTRKIKSPTCSTFRGVSILRTSQQLQQQQQQKHRQYHQHGTIQRQKQQQLQQMTMFSSSSLLSSYSSSHSPSSMLLQLQQKQPPQPQLQHLQQQQRSNHSMKDEYGEMTDDGCTYTHADEFQLECGYTFPKGALQLRYQTYGELNAERDNVLVICHALTGNASLHSWWGDLLGPEKAFDTNKYFVVCCNILGSCYGSTNPTSTMPNDTAEQYGLSFPDVSIQDTVRAQFLLLQKELNIKSIKCVIGGSFGGMQALEFAVQGGSEKLGEFFAGDNSSVPMVRSAIPIGCGAYHKAWQIAISEVQRQAVYSDPNWSVYDKPFEATKGLAVAREMGMISYRTALGYHNKFGRSMMQPKTTTTTITTDSQAQAPQKHEQYFGSRAPWKVKSYLEYQGLKFLDRFDPITYVKLTEQMDSHDITRNRCSRHHQDQSNSNTKLNPTKNCLKEVLQEVTIPVRVLGIDSDILYPLWEQQEIVDGLPNGELRIIHSDDGHDGFLLEQDQCCKYVTEFLEQHD